MTFRNARTRWTSTVVLVVGMVLAGRGLLAQELWVTEDGPVTTTMTWDAVSFEIGMAVDRANLIVADGEDYRDEQVYGPGEVPWIDAVGSFVRGHRRDDAV